VPTFVHQHGRLVENTLPYWQPMQLTQYRCHVLRSPGPSDETGSGVLDGLQPLKQLTTDACEHTVTVVNSTADEGTH